MHNFEIVIFETSAEQNFLTQHARSLDLCITFIRSVRKSSASRTACQNTNLKIKKNNVKLCKYNFLNQLYYT